MKKYKKYLLYREFHNESPKIYDIIIGLSEGYSSDLILSGFDEYSLIYRKHYVDCQNMCMYISFRKNYTECILDKYEYGNMRNGCRCYWSRE